MSRGIFGIIFLCVMWLFVVAPYTGCGNNGELKSCASRSDCESGFTCLNKLCHKQCGKDSDCSDTNETCKQSYCGGIRRPATDTDGGTPPQQECTPGTSENCYSGPSGTEGTGICTSGKKICDDDGKWGECKGEVLPKQFEDCNNKDDNCNGKVDEECGTSCNLGDTRACYTGPQATKDVGPCQAGKETCIKGSDDKPEWGQCEQQVLPIPEICGNSKDDNCDGETDEGCVCKPGTTRDCKADNGCAGIQTCQVKDGKSDYTKCVASKPRAEDCNGLDDDCDGKTDEDENGDVLKRDCTNVCFKGKETCKGGQWRDCDADLPKPETCNNIDDDCDGKIDNIENKDKPIIKGCDSGKPGICKNGIRECKAGTFGDCIAPEPGTEICNDLDDDCDGKTDEDEDKPCGDGQKCIKDTLGAKKCVAE